MSDLQDAKNIIADYHARLDLAEAGAETADVMISILRSDHNYRGMHPFGELFGPTELADIVWSPLKEAMPMLQRRPDIFLAGHNSLPGKTGLWCAQMGHFLGDFTYDWLSIPATKKATYVPYVSLYRVVNDQIVETVEFLDIFAVLTQAGCNPFAASQSGGHIMSPGPKTHDGLLQEPQDSDSTRASFKLTNEMLSDLAKSYSSPADHMARFWHPDMNWFGPAGIGASLGLAGYRRGHTGPFETQLETVEICEEEVTVAEGDYSFAMWWPCLQMRNTGNYMGVPSSDAIAEMRVVDLYRRDGEKLAENWIFIDMLHFLKEQGVDVLGDLT